MEGDSENQTELDKEAELLIALVNEWRENNLRKERKKRKEAPYLKPPQPKLKKIGPTGEVVIIFDKDMQVVPKLEIIEQGTIKIDKVDFPVLSVEVIPNEDQDPKKVDFDWEVTSMTEKEMRIKLFFKTGVYISQQQDPDILKITFRDPSIFVGVNNLVIGE